MKNSFRIIAPAVMAISLLIGTPGAMAVPALRTPKTYTQADGSHVELSRVGDEHGYYYITADAQAMPVINVDGMYYYATAGTPEEPLVSTGVKVTDGSAPMVESAGLHQEIARLLEARTARGPERIAPAENMLTTRMPHVGATRNPVVLVEFQDLRFTVENPVDYFSRQLNEEGFSDNDATGSARDFFIASSRGKYTPDFEVVGLVTLPKSYAYYGKDASAYVIDENVSEMITESVLALADKDWSVYDNDGDTFIDNVTIIYAGFGQASSDDDNTVWPHYSMVYDIEVGSVKLRNYNVINELVDQNWGGRNPKIEPDGIGTFVHEFSHVLGLPDLYSTITASAVYTPGAWSVMDYGPYNNKGKTPPLHSAYEAYCLGWVDLEEITGPMHCELDGSYSNQAYLINTHRTYEFFIFENRSLEGWDMYLPSHGMLIWHIDFVRNRWTSNGVNNDRVHQCVDIVEANNNYFTESGYMWPGLGNRYSTFDANSEPAFLTWDGTDLGLPLTGIARDATTKVVSFDVAGGVARLGTPKVAGMNMQADGTLSFRWNSVSGATVYEVKIYNETKKVWETGRRCIPVTETRIDATGLTLGDTYTIAVRAVSENSRGLYCDPVTVVADPASLDTLDVDNDVPAEYYDLQGRRVNRLLEGNIYIRRQGTSVEKVVI